MCCVVQSLLARQLMNLNDSSKIQFCYTAWTTEWICCQTGLKANRGFPKYCAALPLVLQTDT